ncbi:MAG TPA: glucose-6-phosphate isomerase [Candidatus Polarisedimenticolia bacterium]|nr:glucose-6-phosphate isomerase [Candidatus Polarisedimenticolia bacterium]
MAMPPPELTGLAGAFERARRERWAERLMDRDTSLWSTDPRVRETISQRLGWLDAPRHFREQIAALEGFGDGIRDAGFTTAVVMGMGGSSLAPDVLHRTFGTGEGWLDLRILDSTDPVAVSRTVDDLDPLATLWIVASKSGTTTEPLAFLADAWQRVEGALELRDSPQQPGDFVVAITDPGRSVESIPHHDRLREVFLNPPDIGGRYSALTYVGLIPASLIGLDLDALLSSAAAMLGRCSEPDPADNPGVSLGLTIGYHAYAGRDKLTFFADPGVASLGAWLEQLIAESTGKHGVGIVPVDAEPLGDVDDYADDRVFVRLRLAGSEPHPGDMTIDALEAAGHPVVRIELEDPMDIGGEFVRWEVATAIAGAALRIDPFDQPNVEEAKERTRKLLAHADDDRTTPLADRTAMSVNDAAFVGELRDHLGRRRDNAYLAIQAFVARSDAADAAISRIRRRLREATRSATTTGYGPRFLHSTGQLHKGGAPIGWFLQLTSEHRHDRDIPGWPYTFGQLIDAQAAGDFGAIADHNLPILRIDLGPDVEAGLERLDWALERALTP